MFQLIRIRLLQIAVALGFVCVSSSAFAAIVPLSGVSNFKLTITYQGVSRSVLYFKPTAASTTKVPLLVMLHYNGGTPEAMSTLTEVQELVRDYGIWVALPPVADGSWHDDPTDTSTTDDVGFLTTLIETSVASYPVDVKRVYMTGFSDGAMMTLRYACDRPDKIAAAAAVSGVMLKSLVSVCGSPSFATPMAMINGTADTIVKYSPGKYAISISVPDSAKHWAKINGCGAAPVVSNLADIAPSDGTTVTLTAYLGCATGDSVDLYTVNNGGHTWPGSPYNLNYQGKTTFDIDGTLTVWNFVKGFSR
ncbi:MAG: Polyhydroxybutyrate depolymerase [Hydrocarboniphaga sp.]|uniref:alpha/beta hydrolase family esterase n=1 Tax=Hydrocarboniphaga sp. TaxID=2033016 RepID=UPI0026155C23|nr:PHB depolymerase family esterase [Hydrocarboniphaga sp.]MDB5973173.1 Polyhydroxybutyrate depolymerase [Hydrocarboniphaga sp.]